MATEIRTRCLCIHAGSELAIWQSMNISLHKQTCWLAEACKLLLIPLLQALKEEYQLTLVGHSLGAGAASLLAMMLRANGITNLRCYAFAPPMCCEPDLASSCSDFVTSIVYRDDIISRYAHTCTQTQSLS